MNGKEIFGCVAFGLNDQVSQVEGENSIKSFFLADAVLPTHPSGTILTGDVAEKERIHSGLHWPPEARVQRGEPLRRAPIPCVWQGLVEAGDQFARWHVGKGVNFSLSRIISTHVVTLLKQSECRSQDMVVLAIPDTLDEFGQDALLRDFRKHGFKNIQLLWRPVASAISWISELDQHNVFNENINTNEHIIVVYLGPDGVEMNTFHLRQKKNENVPFVIPLRERPQHISSVIGFDWAANIIDTAYPDIDDGAFWQAFTDFPHVWEAISDRQFSSNNEEWSHKNTWTFWRPDNYLRKCAHQSLAMPNSRLRELLENSCGLLSNNTKSEDISTEESLAKLFINVLDSKPQSRLRGVIVEGSLCPSTLPPWIKSAEEKLQNLGIESISASPQLDAIWLVHDQNACLDGCAEYGRRLDNGLPTYLDTLPELALLVEQRGKNVWETLLNAETCEGGKPYRPDPIQGQFGIQAGAQNLQVYLKKEGTRIHDTLETSKEFREYQTSLSPEEIAEIDKKVQQAGTYEEVLNLFINDNVDTRRYSKHRARGLFGNPFRKASFAFPSVPDKKMPVDISVEIRPASGLAQITLAPSNLDDKEFLRGRQIFLDYSTMAEADPPPPPTRGWPSVIKIKVDPMANFLRGNRWDIKQYLKTNPDSTQFMGIVNRISKVLQNSPRINGIFYQDMKNIDQDGNAGTEQASLKIDEIANSTAEYFQYVNSANKRKFVTRMTWLFGKAPKNLKREIYNYISGPYNNNWVWMVEAAGRVFIKREEYIFLYSKIINRINSNHANPFPNQSSKALWLLLSLREDSALAMKRVQAKTFTGEAIKIMEQQTHTNNYHHKFFNAARLFLFLLRFRVIDQTFLDPDNPLDSNLFERTINCLKSAEEYFSHRNDPASYQAKKIVIGIEKFMRYEGNNEILIDLNTLAGD